MVVLAAVRSVLLLSMNFIGSVMVLIVSMLSMSIWANSVVGIAVCMLLYFVAFNFLEATMPALVSRIAPASQKGSAMGGYSSSQFLGAFLGGKTS